MRKKEYRMTYMSPTTKVVEINSYGTMLLEPSKYNGFEGEEEEL